MMSSRVFLGGVACGVVCGAAVTVASVWLSGRLRRDVERRSRQGIDYTALELLQQLERLRDVDPSGGGAKQSPGRNATTDFELKEDSILQEQFVRNVQFFGDDGQRKVMDSFVVVVGLGGVGEACCMMCAR